MCSVLELSPVELGRVIAQGRTQLQTWLDAHTICDR